MPKAGKYLIRGRPGSGKSTAIGLIIAGLERKGISVGGIRTPEIRSGGARTGFAVVDIHSGESEVFASIDYSGGPKVSKYTVKVDLFERIAIPAIKRALEGMDVLVIDEIGKMELFSKPFVRLVREAWASDRVCVGTGPSYKIPFVEEVASLSEVFWIEKGMAERVAMAIVSEILGLLGR